MINYNHMIRRIKEKSFHAVYWALAVSILRVPDVLIMKMGRTYIFYHIDVVRG
ncbi:MAG TPA: hypothetical protein GX510_10515 [Firmicutes bacterium]|nr:hypothetical protein [Candidatus Fermentithermobacillaceae bacterium]